MILLQFYNCQRTKIRIIAAFGTKFEENSFFAIFRETFSRIIRFILKTQTMSNNKRLERDTRSKVLGGVCSGLGNYFDMDPAFWRVLFFLLFFFGCSGLLIYLIMWAIMPARKEYATAEAADSLVNTEEAQKPKKNGNMVAGLTLIGLGALFLIGRYVPEINWHTAWPVLLIILGLVLIIPINSKKNEK